MNCKLISKVLGITIIVMVLALGLLLTSNSAHAGGLTKGDTGKAANMPDYGYTQESSVTAYNSSANEYLTLWQDTDTAYGDYDIYGRRISSTGALLGSPIAVAIGHGDQTKPAIAFNTSAGEYLAVWQDDRVSGTLQIYGQRIAPDGSLIGSNFLVSDGPADAHSPSLAYNSTNHEYLVAWEDSRNPPYFDIYAQELNGSGSPVGNDHSVWASNDYNDESPALAYNPASNRYILAWQTLGTAPGSSWDIVSSAINIDGTVASGRIFLETAANQQLGPALAYNSVNDQMLVVWHDWRNGAPNIWGAMVSSTGSLLGSDFSLYTGSNNQVWPQVVYNSYAAVYLVTWQDYRGSDYNIYGRTVGYNGVVSSEYPISTAIHDQEFPHVAANTTPGDFLVTWDDTRNGNSDVYAQRVRNGSIEGSDFQLAPGACTLTFSDVPAGSTFYTNIACLVCRGIISGYADGTFRPNNSITRGQLSKIVANAAGFNDAPGAQLFKDIPAGSTFYDYIQRLANRTFVSGYACGGPGEPCGPGNLPYFRPNTNASRGQISKIVARSRGWETNLPGQTFQDVPLNSTFHLWIENLASQNVMGGYPCGGPNEPCVAPGNKPYFRPGNDATRGQVSKIVQRTFFSECNN